MSAQNVKAPSSLRLSKCLGHKPTSTLRSIYACRYLYFLLLPALVWYILFKYAPMYGVILSFKQFSFKLGILGSPWVGLANFEKAFSTRQFWNAVHNTLAISLGKMLFVFPCPIIVALLLNEIRVQWYKRFVQTLLYLPHFVSWVILSGIVVNLLSVNGGLINKLIVFFGGDVTNFLVRADLFKAIVFVSNIWKETGWTAIIYIAALSGIDPGLYEAAVVDGAGRFKRFLYITWPELRFTVIVLLILNAGSIMNAGFDQIFNLYNKAVYSVADIIDTYVYRETLMKADFSYGTAVGLFQSVINCILLFTVNKSARLMGGNGLY